MLFRPTPPLQRTRGLWSHSCSRKTPPSACLSQRLRRTPSWRSTFRTFRATFRTTCDMLLRPLQTAKWCSGRGRQVTGMGMLDQAQLLDQLRPTLLGQRSSRLTRIRPPFAQISRRRIRLHALTRTTVITLTKPQESARLLQSRRQLHLLPATAMPPCTSSTSI